MQEHEESGWDVVRVVELMKENVPKHIADSYSDDIQSAHKIVEQVLRARVEFQREKGNERLDIDMPIILEACHFGDASSRRYWGKLQIKHGEPTFNAVMRKTNQLAWGLSKMREGQLEERMNIVLLKCQNESPSTEEASTSGHVEEEEEDDQYYDPVLEELMMAVEEEAMSLNKTYGKLKASIVICTSEELVSDKYLAEIVYLRGLDNLAYGNKEIGRSELKLVRSQMWRLRGVRSNFKTTPYGRFRVQDDGPH